MDATASDPSSPPRSRRCRAGKRPPRLAVNAESLKIKKPAVTPRPKKSHHLQQTPARAPVIIYDASPQVIGVKPADFVMAMARVQRCIGPLAAAPDCVEYAGPSQSVVLSSPSVQFPPRDCLLSLLPTTAALSASARLAATERAVRPPPLALLRPPTDYGADADSLAAVLSLPRRPGILSPAALPPAACSRQFSAAMSFDPSCLSWLNEQSSFFLPAASSCVGELGCLTLNRSTLLPGAMPCPATVSTPGLSRNLLEMFRNILEIEM
jgi:hypothetical protein